MFTGIVAALADAGALDRVAGRDLMPATVPKQAGRRCSLHHARVVDNDLSSSRTDRINIVDLGASKGSRGAKGHLRRSDAAIRNAFGVGEIRG